MVWCQKKSDDDIMGFDHDEPFFDIQLYSNIIIHKINVTQTIYSS